MGRPKKLTAELTATMCDALRQGATRRSACALAGISHTTFYRWIDEAAEKGEGPEHDFRASIEASEAKNEQVYASALHDVAIGDDLDAKTADRVRALTFFLTHRHGWVQRTEVSGPAGAPVQIQSIDAAAPSVADGLAHIEALRARVGPPRP